MASAAQEIDGLAKGRVNLDMVPCTSTLKILLSTTVLAQTMIADYWGRYSVAGMDDMFDTVVYIPSVQAERNHPAEIIINDKLNRGDLVIYNDIAFATPSYSLARLTAVLMGVAEGISFGKVTAVSISDLANIVAYPNDEYPEKICRRYPPGKAPSLLWTVDRIVDGLDVRSCQVDLDIEKMSRIHWARDDALRLAQLRHSAISISDDRELVPPSTVDTLINNLSPRS